MDEPTRTPDVDLAAARAALHRLLDLLADRIAAHLIRRHHQAANVPPQAPDADSGGGAGAGGE